MGTGMIDLGRSMIKEQNAPQIAHAIISHYHWDHLFGFLGFDPLFNSNFTFNMYGKEDKMTPQEIIQYIFANSSEYGFWMKLNTLYRVFFVSDTHNNSIICPCCHFQFIWKAF